MAQQLWPSYESLCGQLKRWHRDHPRLVQLREMGRSAQSRPLLAAVLTDRDLPDDDKEHVLVTALHSGIERSGSLGVFGLVEWLLSADGRARSTLQRQVVVCMPVVNPDGYEAGSAANTLGHDQYVGWTSDGPLVPQQNPEAATVQQLMDEFQPEVHADMHGLDMSFPGYIMVENSGGSWSNVSLRPYHRDIMRLMGESALKEGYPSVDLEQDSERLYWGPELDHMAHRLWLGRPRYYAATYCYEHYHSLVLASEILWADSAVARHRRLLQIGNEVWPGEHCPGYPTRVISRNEFHSIVACGTCASERRRSRVELWAKLGQVTHGMVNPQREGTVLYVCATSPEAARRWLGDTTLEGFLKAIGDHPHVEADPIRQALKGYPTGSGQWGDCPRLYLTGGQEGAAAAPIEHGIALRLSVPYASARLRDLRVNGHAVSPSETDGYLTWSARGFTYMQINLPPGRTGSEGLFVVTWRYDPRQTRRHWSPPDEAM